MQSLSPFPIPVNALKPVSCGSTLWRRGGTLRASFTVKLSLGLVHERTAWPTTPVDLIVEDRRSSAQSSSSLIEASELFPYLPNAAVLLSARAYAPQGRPTSAVSARLAIFREQNLLDKTVHVFGERTASAPQHPRPFERIPLVYERTVATEENPVGMPSSGATLPNICDSTNPSRAAGFGPISKQWPQRRRLLGTLDPSRFEGVVADFPDGFDFRWFNPAPLDQQIDYLRGDEWIVLDGMHPQLQRVQSRLPQMRGKACVFFVGPSGVTHRQLVDLVADMLVIDADRLVASVVFRGSLPLDSLDVLPRLRVFADVELPGNPTRWPEAAEVMRAKAPAPINPAADLRSTQTNPRDDSAIMKAALPFQPKPPGAMTVVPFMTPPPARPKITFDDNDPLMRTVAADEESGLRPAMPFAHGSTQTPAQPRPPLAPPPSTRRPASDDDESTRAIDLDKLESKRAAATPFLPSRKGDADDATRAIDISALEAKRSAVTPFAPADADKPSVFVSPPPASAEKSKPKFNTIPLQIEDPLTEAALLEREADVLPFLRAQSPAPTAPPPVVAPPTVVAAPPAMVAPPTVVAAPPAMVAPPTVVAPPVFVRNEPEPPPVVAPPPPAATTTNEPKPEAAPPPVVASNEPAPAPVAPAVEETGLRAIVLERLRSKVPAPLHDLTVTGADLSNLDFRGANLSGHDLGGVKFCKTNLTGARLGGARLVDADLEGADLTDADLTGADLSRANLTNARLVGVRMDQASFASAQGKAATFDGAKGRATLFVRGQWTNTSFRGLDVFGADFTGASLDDAVLERAVLVDAKFNDARGKGANFDSARIEQANADGSAFVECTFRDVDAKGSIWENATVDGSSFDGARMENAVFVRSNCHRAKFVKANLRGANFGRAQGDAVDFSNAELDGADFRQAKFAEGRFEQARLINVLAPRADFSRSHFVKADLSNGSLRAALMGGANLTSACLDGADLRDADLKRSILVKASRTGAKMTGANTKDCIEHDPNE